MEKGSTRLSDQNCGAEPDPVIGTTGPPLDPNASRQATERSRPRRRREGILVAPLERALDKPLLFVDIDGVISLFGFASAERPAGTWLNVDGVPHLISATASGHLLALAHVFELVWCSGWEDKADEHLVHALALPDRPPFLTFTVAPGGTHWKLDAVQRYAGGRPAAWIDDAFDDSCHAWAAARGAPTLLVTTNAAVGLTEEHVARLVAWAGGLERR
jgi:hypothetical protein